MLGKNLRSMREIAGMSQTEVARDLKLNRVTYNRYETGEREPGVQVLLSLAAYFDVSLDFLLGRTPLRLPLNALYAQHSSLSKDAVEKINAIISSCHNRNG